ncbi:MAG: 50S ribosomal protein L32 [Desulfovibrionaceae bacterium]|nr:50S ribosomal protein L32 [Desulfovibrionaceae bacterium]
MAVQQNKKSRSRKGMRRSHDRIAVPTVVYCHCGSPRLPHKICPQCGEYRGEKHIEIQEAATSE